MSITAKGTTNPSNDAAFAVTSGADARRTLFGAFSKVPRRPSLKAKLVLKLCDKYSTPCGLKALREIHDAAGKTYRHEATQGGRLLGGGFFHSLDLNGTLFFSGRKNFSLRFNRGPCGMNRTNGALI
jgi:hypothetical protein